SNHIIRKVTSAGESSLLAGYPGLSGSEDGLGLLARFNFPYSVAVDGTGDIYVADASNHNIRRVTSAGEESRLAGLAGSSGSEDGLGSLARFNSPYSVAVDGAGNIYVADTSNQTIRRVTSAGEVSTLAGLAGLPGSADGLGPVGRFYLPTGVTVDGTGNVYVADSGNHTIRKVTPSGGVGAVTTIAGRPTSRGILPGVLPATLSSPVGLALMPAGDLIVTSVNSVLQVTAF